MRRKNTLRIILAALFLIFVYVFYYCWRAFPIATGFAAKATCSALFVSGREEADIISNDLDFFPVSYTSVSVDYQDSSVTASFFGLAEQKAIYRKGLGATLVNDVSEEEIRSQQFRLAIKPQVNQDTIAWPSGNRKDSAYPANIDSTKLNTAIDILFHAPQDKHRNITRAVIVLYKGQIVAERYAPGFSENTKLTGWSMTKSITSALTGTAVEQGLLQVDSAAPVPEWKNISDPRHKITLKNLLQQTSGIDFTEVYTTPADANRMLFREGDAAKFTSIHPLLHKPGTKFRYSSGNTNLISRILRSKIGDRNYHAFPYEQLFFRIGMFNTVMEPDASGTFVGSSFCYATARDWARFGLLYYNLGNWNDEQIISADWIRKTLEPAQAAELGEYGFQWWLNSGSSKKPVTRRYPELPQDMYWADGFEGQNVFVIPSKKLVVVRLGMTRTNDWGEQQFLKDIIAAQNSAQ